MLKSLKYFTFTLGAITVMLAGCAQQSNQNQQPNNQAQSDTTAAGSDISSLVAVVHPTEGNNVTGTVTFEQTSEGVRVQAEVQGLEEGQHGFHVHQYGDCTASDATSAGGHYNPANNPHGAPDDQQRHVGDMGNIEADAQGMASRDYVDDVIELTGPNGILGRAVVIHGGQDDLTSQPSGDAGPRLACGVIGIANPE